MSQDSLNNEQKLAFMKKHHQHSINNNQQANQQALNDQQLELYVNKDMNRIQMLQNATSKLELELSNIRKTVTSYKEQLRNKDQKIHNLTTQVTNLQQAQNSSEWELQLSKNQFDIKNMKKFFEKEMQSSIDQLKISEAQSKVFQENNTYLIQENQELNSKLDSILEEKQILQQEVQKKRF